MDFYLTKLRLVEVIYFMIVDWNTSVWELIFVFINSAIKKKEIEKIRLLSDIHKEFTVTTKQPTNTSYYRFLFNN